MALSPPRIWPDDGRLPIRLVHGGDLLDRLGLDPNFETDRVTRDGIEGTTHAARAFEFPIALRHIHHGHFVRI